MKHIYKKFPSYAKKYKNTNRKDLIKKMRKALKGTTFQPTLSDKSIQVFLDQNERSNP